MGRRPLDSKHLEIMIDYAMQCGDEGFTRAEAIREGVMTENRWALLRDKALREGLLRKEGWKKSARYFFDGEAYQIQQEEKDLEDEDELDLEDLDDDEEFPWHEANEPEEEEHLGENDDDLPFVIELPFEDIPDDNDVEDLDDDDVGVGVVDDDDDLAAIINALGEDEQAPPLEPEKQPDLDWDFTF